MRKTRKIGFFRKRGGEKRKEDGDSGWLPRREKRLFLRSAKYIYRKRIQRFFALSNLHKKQFKVCSKCGLLFQADCCIMNYT